MLQGFYLCFWLIHNFFVLISFHLRVNIFLCTVFIFCFVPGITFYLLILCCTKLKSALYSNTAVTCGFGVYLPQCSKKHRIVQAQVFMHTVLSLAIYFLSIVLIITRGFFRHPSSQACLIFQSTTSNITTGYPETTRIMTPCDKLWMDCFSHPPTSMKNIISIYVSVGPHSRIMVLFMDR